MLKCFWSRQTYLRLKYIINKSTILADKEETKRIHTHTPDRHTYTLTKNCIGFKYVVALHQITNLNIKQKRCMCVSLFLYHSITLNFFSVKRYFQRRNKILLSLPRIVASIALQ